jgi:hypothetical protein
VPVLVSEGDGVWAFYVKAELEGTEYRMTSPGGYGSWPSGYNATVWKDAGALRVGGQVGDKAAARFLNGEFSNEEVADLMRLANLQTEQMNAEAVVEAWRTAGQFIPGVGAGVALAEGDGFRGSAYFVRDVVLTVTGTKLLQGGKTLAGMTLRSAGLGAMQGGTSAAFDIGAARAEAAWNGETYAGTVNGDAWEMFRATRNGAAFGLVLGPVAKMASLRKATLERGDDLISFYHGTSHSGASSIRSNGIDLSLGNRGADFGQGFYLSSSREVAESAARRLYGNAVEVLEFQVSRNQLSRMSGLRFGSSSTSWADFTRFHKTFGPQNLIHGGTRYDFVTGPMVRRIRSNGEVLAWPDASQFSIHTRRAVDLFNRGLR